MKNEMIHSVLQNFWNVQVSKPAIDEQYTEKENEWLKLGRAKEKNEADGTTRVVPNAQVITNAVFKVNGEMIQIRTRLICTNRVRSYTFDNDDNYLKLKELFDKYGSENFVGLE